MTLMVHQMAFAAERRLLPRQAERDRRLAAAATARIAWNDRMAARQNPWPRLVAMTRRRSRRGGSLYTVHDIA
jgi:hypothetical protein